MDSDHLMSAPSSSAVPPVAPCISKQHLQEIIGSSIGDGNSSKPVPNYFRNVFLATERAARYKFSHWIRLFVYYGGVILSTDDQHLATHVLHVSDVEPFENAEKYRDIRQAVHINVEWIKDTIRKGCLQDDRPYRITILPKYKLE